MEGTDMSVGRVAVGAGGLAALSRRALIAAALLALLLGAAIYAGLTARHSWVAPAVRFGASSHLRSRADSHKAGLSSLPPAAQGPISEALGADDPAYRVSSHERRVRRDEFRTAPAHELRPLRSIDQLRQHAAEPERARNGLRQLAERPRRGRAARQGQSRRPMNTRASASGMSTGRSASSRASRSQGRPPDTQRVR